MTALLATIQKELLLLRRDIHGLLLLFIMPMAFILIMSLALQDQFTGTRTPHIAVQLRDQTQSAATQRVIALLQQQKNFTWQTTDNSHAAFLLTLTQGDDAVQADILVAPDTSATSEALFTATVPLVGTDTVVTAAVVATGL